MDFGRRANRLTEFQRGQLSDHEISKDERNKKSSDRRGDRAKRDIKENVEAEELFAKAVKVIHHGATPSVGCRLTNSSSTSSVRAARLPLMSTSSPGAAISVNISAA